MPAFARKRSPDGATTNFGGKHPITAYFWLSTLKGWVSLIGWAMADGFLHKWAPSATGQAEDREVRRPKTDAISLWP